MNAHFSYTRCLMPLYQPTHTFPFQLPVISPGRTGTGERSLGSLRTEQEPSLPGSAPENLWTRTVADTAVPAGAAATRIRRVGHHQM